MNISSFFDYPSLDSQIDPEELIFLPQWSHQNWTRLLAHTQTYLFSPGDTAIALGNDDRAVYMVAAGQFEVVAPQSRRGRAPRQIATLPVGSIAGEQTFLDSKPHTAQVRAVTDGELVRLSYDAFEIFAAREPELARDLLLDLGRILSLRLRHALAEQDQ